MEFRKLIDHCDQILLLVLTNPSNDFGEVILIQGGKENIISALNVRRI